MVERGQVTPHHRDPVTADGGSLSHRGSRGQASLARLGVPEP
jgi:hypothetical protein